MSTFLIACLVIFIMTVFILIMEMRAAIVHAVRVEAIFAEKTMATYEKLPSYSRMMFQFTKWKYSHWVKQ